jgi:hypothetical protein
MAYTGQQIETGHNPFLERNFHRLIPLLRQSKADIAATFYLILFYEWTLDVSKFYRMDKLLLS